jgi:hypothetical protein
MSIKNQIKSYTAQVTKQKTSDFFVFLGGVSTQSNLVDDNDISVVSRIQQNEVSTVVARVNWQPNAQYSPFTLTYNGSDSYVYNDQTGVVYLCVGINQPTGLRGDTRYPASIAPSHSIGVVTGSDGYSWLALYRIDMSLEKFITTTAIPVNSLYDYRTDNLAGSYGSKYNGICNGNFAATGSCYFYYNEKVIDPVTDSVFNIGDQVLGISTNNWICSVCHEVGDKLGYKSYHVTSSNSQSQITRNPIADVEAAINSGYLDVNNKDYIQYSNFSYLNGLNHAILNLQLDVENLSIEQRIVPTQNPHIEVLDSRGIEATARIRTYYDIQRNAFIASGVELLSGGYNYINPTFRVTGGTSALNAAISAVVIDPISLLDPSTILPNPRISIVKTFSSSDFTNTYKTNQTTFTKIGIVNNVLTLDDTNASQGKLPSEAVDYRSTSILTLQVAGFVPIPPDIDVGNVSVKENSTTTVTIDPVTNSDVTSADYISKIVSIEENQSGQYLIEISSTDELTFNAITTADSVYIADVEYTVVARALPEIKIDNVEYVTVRSLTSPLNIATPSTKENQISINFLI